MPDRLPRRPPSSSSSVSSKPPQNQFISIADRIQTTQQQQQQQQQQNNDSKPLFDESVDEPRCKRCHRLVPNTSINDDDIVDHEPEEETQTGTSTAKNRLSAAFRRR